MGLYRSVERVYRARNQLGLVGKHIHIQTGAWTEAISGIGYNADSFYEYTLKASILFGDERYKAMFDVLYSAVEHRLRNGDWYTEFDMRLGRPKDFTFNSLQAFWPGLQTIAAVDDLDAVAKAANSTNAFMSIWRKFAVLPEQYDYVRGASSTTGSRSKHKAMVSAGAGLMGLSKPEGAQSRSYLLRPELVRHTHTRCLHIHFNIQL